MTTRPILRHTLAVTGLALLAACGSVSTDQVTVQGSDGPTTELVEVDEVELDVADFTLKDTAGKEHTLSEYVAAGNTVVLEWFNPDCPFVKKYHDGEDRMVAVYEAMQDDKLIWLAINSGAEGKQGAGLERNKKAIAEWKLPYPVLLDMDGKVGRAYGAATTPHMFIISPEGALLYEGAIDDSNGRGESKTNYVTKTLKEYRAGEPVSVKKTKSFGCSVKYGK